MTYGRKSHDLCGGHSYDGGYDLKGAEGHLGVDLKYRSAEVSSLFSGGHLWGAGVGNIDLYRTGEL